MDVLGLVGLAVVLFATTNIDDMFILLSFRADGHSRGRQIALGYYLGIAAIVLTSLVASLVSLAFAPEYVGWLGLLPIAIGVKKALDLWRGQDEEQETHSLGVGKVLAIAGAIFADGGDNIGVYTPVFATSTVATILIIVAVFAAMALLWLALSHWLVTHRALGAPIRRVGPVLAPVVLIALGLFILYDSGALSF